MKLKIFKTCSFIFILTILIGAITYIYHLHATKSMKVPDTATVDKMGIEGLGEYYNIPGFAYSVIKEGDVVKEGASGFIYKGSNLKVNIENRFNIGSLTKSFTGLIAAKLIDDGVLSWDTNFFDIYPDWKTEANPAYYSITLKDLLSMRAKIQPFTHDVVDSELPLSSTNPIDRRAEFGKYVLSLSPVPENTYSNASFSLASIMLEKVSGKSWESLALQTAKEIDISIDFGRPNKRDINQTWGHRKDWFGNMNPVSPKEENSVPFVTAPSGDINMTISDMSKYVNVYIEGISGKNSYIKSTTCNYLLFGIPEYSIGWGNAYDGDTYAFHNGSDGTYLSHVMIFKELKSAIIILTNAPNIKDTQNFIADLRNYLKLKYIYS
jgi:CubicO group peptidase (beta-lactamase class C family)